MTVNDDSQVGAVGLTTLSGFTVEDLRERYEFPASVTDEDIEALLVKHDAHVYEVMVESAWDAIDDFVRQIGGVDWNLTQQEGTNG